MVAAVHRPLLTNSASVWRDLWVSLISVQKRNAEIKVCDITLYSVVNDADQAMTSWLEGRV